MATPYALFCADPLDPRSVDPAFQAEMLAARAAGFAVARLDHDELDHRIDADAALRPARLQEGGKAVYRGWMLSDTAYAALYVALRGRGVELITSPEAYAACHMTPGSYPALFDWMPLTTWVPQSEMDDGDAVQAALSGFGSAPIIVKDWVKSQAAGYWSEACFIPDASDRDRVLNVISRFRELQAESLAGGLVFKRYVPLIPEGLPALEHRAFIANGTVVGCWPRSPEAREIGEPPASLLEAVASRVPSPFASADFGLDRQGRWWLLEVGDGQVSGLPQDEAAEPIFRALAPMAGAE